MPEIVHDFNNSLRNTFRFVEVTEGNDRFYPVTNSNFDPTQYIDSMTSLRRELLDSLEENTEGIDIQAVENYFAERGMTIGDYLIVDQKQILRYNEIAEPFDFNYPLDDNDPSSMDCDGFVVDGLNLALVFRNEAEEERYGPIVTEGILVHELAHTATSHTIWTVLDADGYHMTNFTRTGFGIKGAMGGNWTGPPQHRNAFLEEGFAAFCMRDYFRQRGLEPGCTYLGPDDIAGEALDDIAQRIPDFHQTLIDARTSLAGLRKLAKQIESLQPGLYMQLSKLSYDDDYEFTKGANMIHRALAVRALNK